MDLGDTIQHILNLTGDPESEEFQQSWPIIEEYRQTEFALFLDQMIQIYMDASQNQSLRHLAIILSYQPFPTSYENLNKEFFQNNNLPDELISQILATSSECFTDESLNIRMAAVTLFSRIACIDVLTTDSFDITKTLITGFINPTSAESFECICVALIDLFGVTSMEEEEFNTMLEALFGYLSSDEETVSSPMKCYCLKILSILISNMNEILTDDENIKSLFEALFIMSQNPETKADAFYCWCEITVNYYPLLEIVAEQLAESSFIELTEEENDRETVIIVCDFWGSIAECELRKKSELNIIKQVVGDLLPILFNISVKIPFDVCDNDEDNEPHIAAGQAMQNVVAVAPEESMPILVNFIHEFAGSQGEENFNLREGVLNCVNFIIQFCDCSPILMDSMELIYGGLLDGSPRVRQTAVYCVHAILNSILRKADDCPFAELVPQIGPRIVQLAAIVMSFMNGENIDVQVAATAALTTADFIQFPGFPYAGRALSLLLNSAIQDTIQDSLILSKSAFSALKFALGECPEQLLIPIMKAILELMKQAIESSSDFSLINQLCYLLQVIYVRLKGEIDSETVEFSWSLFELTFNQYTEEAVTLLSKLATFARAAGDLFIPYLATTAEFIYNGLETYELDEAIPSAALGVTLLSECFDLSPYAMHFFESLTKAVANEEVPLRYKRYVADAIGNLATNSPDVFAQVAEEVIEPIDGICQNVIGNIITYAMKDNLFDDDFDIDDIVCSFLKCLQNMVISLSQSQSELASAAANVLSDLLEFVGGMEEHGDKLLTIAVGSMELLINAFPDDMKESFEDEPGFVEILHEAQAAEIMPDVIEMIFQFMSS